MTRKSELSYEKISDGARSREQYRSAFSIAVVATAFVAPTGNPFEVYLKFALCFSALFSALYLIASAARIKYSEPGRLYEVFYVNERLRMWAYDWSLHIFAAAFLYFVSLMAVILIGIAIGIRSESTTLQYMSFCMFGAIGLVVLLVTDRISSKEPKKALPEI